MTIPTPAQKRKILAEEHDPAPTLPPTPAQIEAAIKAMQELWIYPTHDWQFKPMAEAALTAAAQVGGPPDDSMEGAINRGQQQAIAEEAAQAGEVPTDKMMIEHLNDQIQTLLCENEQLRATAAAQVAGITEEDEIEDSLKSSIGDIAAQVVEQEITGLKAMLVDAGAKIERMKEMLLASEKLRDHAERELGKDSELVKRLQAELAAAQVDDEVSYSENDVKIIIAATIKRCALLLEERRNRLIKSGAGHPISQAVIGAMESDIAAIRKLKDEI